MVKYKILNVREELHKKLKLRATKNDHTIIEELEAILADALGGETDG